MFVDPLRAADVRAPLRDAARALGERVERLGASRLVIAPGWEAFAAACGLDSAGGPGASIEAAAVAVAVGGPSDIAAMVNDAQWRDLQWLAVVAPTAVRQAGTNRFADLTLDLWGAGWTPIEVTRVELAVSGDSIEAVVEVVVALARPTPGDPGADEPSS